MGLAPPHDISVGGTRLAEAARAALAMTLLRLIYHPWMPLELVKVGNYFVEKWQRRKWERLGKAQ